MSTLIAAVSTLSPAYLCSLTTYGTSYLCYFIADAKSCALEFEAETYLSNTPRFCGLSA